MLLAFLEKYLGGHIHIGSLTIYGFNAMHVAINLRTKRWGFICWHPTIWWGRWWRWYFYVSPNGTPWAATFTIGPGIEQNDREKAPLRRKKFGHNFDVNWNYGDLCEINGIASGSSFECSGISVFRIGDRQHFDYVAAYSKEEALEHWEKEVGEGVDEISIVPLWLEIHDFDGGGKVSLEHIVSNHWRFPDFIGGTGH